MKPPQGPVSCLLNKHLAVLEKEIGSAETITATSDPGESLTEARQQQFLAGMKHVGWRVNSFAKAVAVTDDQEIEVTPFTLNDGRAFVLYSYHAGSNPHGFVFEDAEQIVTSFCDDDLCHCTVEIGTRCLFDAPELDIVLRDETPPNYRVRYHSDNFVAMPAIRKQQLLRGVEHYSGETLASPEVAFNRVDQGPRDPRAWSQTESFGGIRLVYFDITFGGNGYGFVVPDGMTPVARYADGYLDECSISALPSQ